MSYRGHEYFAEFDGNQSIDNGKLGRKLAKGGGGGGSSTVSQVTIPKELIPYVKGSIEGAKEVAALPYVAYGGQRLADLTPQQMQAMSGVMGLQSPQQFDAATRGAYGTGQLGFTSAQQGLGKALGYGATPLEQLGMAAPEEVTGRTLAKYMSPYQQQVSDIAAREAQRQAAITQRQADLNAVGQGTYGGARQALMQAERERNLGQNISDIYTKGQQSAYEQAMAEANRYRAAQQTAQQQNLAAETQRRQLQEQARQTGAQLGAQVGSSGLGTSLQAAQLSGQLGQSQQEAALARLNAQNQMGQQLQAQQQASLAQKYQDFLAQKGYPQETATWYSNIVRGLPISPASTQVTTTPAPSMMSQLGGLGLAGLGLYNMANK